MNRGGYPTTSRLKGVRIIPEFSVLVSIESLSQNTEFDLGGVCVWGWGGNYLYMTKYGCACRIAPFFSAARCTISPLF